ncbi:MAG: BBP7 family outer membrane beta-barrel protein [Planctomycetes bacterium]|nr:BBP7 family outer membrane beta-barrel protein [Planctomycetota bacterium]
MRIGHSSVLALMLFASAPSWGQPTDRIVPPDAGRGTATPPANAPFLLDQDAGLVDEYTPLRPASPQLFWLRADYLNWVITKEPIAPVIATLPDSLASARDIPAGAATPIFPSQYEVNYKRISGLRLNTGFWFGMDRGLGFDVSGFGLENQAQRALYVSNGSPILTRLYNSLNDNRQTNLIFSTPDPAFPYRGSIAASLTATDIFNADASIRWRGFRVFADNADWLFGARYFNMRESLDVIAQATFPDGRRFTVADQFRVHNSFYGGQIGINSRWVGYNRFSLDGTFKFAVGGVNQRVEIRGSNSLVQANGQVLTQPVGLWAQGNNSGEFSKGKFAVIPEIGFNLNYNVTDRAAIYFGWTGMFISNVVRINSVVNTNVNTSNTLYLPNSVPSTRGNPGFSFNDTGMWIQGINLGARFEY